MREALHKRACSEWFLPYSMWGCHNKNTMNCNLNNTYFSYFAGRESKMTVYWQTGTRRARFLGSHHFAVSSHRGRDEQALWARFSKGSDTHGGSVLIIY